jgi:hypothetical protein
MGREDRPAGQPAGRPAAHSGAARRLGPAGRSWGPAKSNAMADDRQADEKDTADTAGASTPAPSTELGLRRDARYFSIF